MEGTEVGIKLGIPRVIELAGTINTKLLMMVMEIEIGMVIPGI